MTSRKQSTGKSEPMDVNFEDCTFEESLAVSKSSKGDKKFDTVIGHIEDIIMDERFQKLQNDFMEEHYQIFEDVEENKLVYTEIHQRYTQQIETFLENELHRRMPGFDMADFQKQLMHRRKELDGEIFEILLTFSDFLAFKEMLLDYKTAKEGCSFNLGDGLTVLQLKHLQTMESCETIPHATYAPQPDVTLLNGETTEEPTCCNLEPSNDDSSVSYPMQSLSIQGNNNFDFCIIGSSIKSARQ